MQRAQLILKNFKFATNFNLYRARQRQRRSSYFLATKFAMPEKKALYFGDTLKDFEAADYAGFDFIGIGDNQDFKDRSIFAVHDFKYLELSMKNKVA